MTSVQAFWHFLYVLQHVHNTCGAVTTQGRVIYGGNCLQAFTTALQQHVSFIWDIVGS